MEDVLLEGFDALMPWNGLGRAGRWGSGGEKILEDALLKGFEAVRPPNVLGRTSKVWVSGERRSWKMLF